MSKEGGKGVGCEWRKGGREGGWGVSGGRRGVGEGVVWERGREEGGGELRKLETAPCRRTWSAGSFSCISSRRRRGRGSVAG